MNMTYLKRILAEVKRIPKALAMHCAGALGIMIGFTVTGANGFHTFLAALLVLAAVEVGQLKGKVEGSFLSKEYYLNYVKALFSPELVAQWAIPVLVTTLAYLVFFGG